MQQIGKERFFYSMKNKPIICNEPPTTLISMDSDRYHCCWRECGGRFLSEPIRLGEGSYTFTWSLEAVEENPFFQAELQDPNGNPVTLLPPGDDGDGVGHHTVTVTIETALAYRLYIVARNVIWEMGVLRLPQSPR
ncbi:hypothetical protein [Desmospora profundinema]|uniref:Uncharacterized protein n=1 Tax=Desmospora profundinema TaxID=1571184 RepID=A0ABU1IMF9_9BACL|nr:hypothetical protein [Desmospora profundinema]MDR6225956.1 hypothetical protein [Desmospora profundinema]